jgi:Cu(I)/Ag(I) efflux system membrane fusion protein
VRATGTVAFDERAISVVPSRVAGIVERLQVRAPLTRVRRGEPLATLLAPDWTAAQEDYLALRRASGIGMGTLRTAARQRLLLLGMDEGMIRSLERSGRAQMRFTLTAPRDGVVVELAVREGASVAAGAPLLTLNGLDTVWMNAAIAEADAAHVAAGAAATVSLPAFPGERFAGTIEALLPDLDAATRTQRARIVLANLQHRFVPGMFGTVDIAVSAAAPHVLVPSEAIIATGMRNVVIVDTGGGRYRAQEVRSGAEGGGNTVVLDGIAEGENVVLSGQFLIDSEASLSGVLARLGDNASDAAPAPARNAAAPAPERHRASGRVLRIAGTRWSIATDAIASLGMGAMSMDFVLPASVPAKAIGAGQAVNFSFVRNAEGEFEIVEIAAHDAPAKRGEP